MRSFLTGSRMYGTPSETSDIDLVIQVSRAELDMLAELCDLNKTPTRKENEYGPYSASLQFGKLNLIVTTDEATFAAWRLGTDSLCTKGAKIPREDAVTVFKSLFAMMVPPEASEQSTTVNFEAVAVST